VATGPDRSCQLQEEIYALIGHIMDMPSTDKLDSAWHPSLWRRRRGAGYHRL